MLHLSSVLKQKLDCVGKIIFLCAVIRLDSVENRKKKLTVKPETARVYLIYFESFLIGVFLLNNCTQISVFVTDNSAVTCRIVNLCGNNRCGTTVLNMSLRESSIVLLSINGASPLRITTLPLCFLRKSFAIITA